VVTVAHGVARIIFYMLRRGEPYWGVKGELCERKPREDGEECVKRLTELMRMPLGCLSFQAFFHRSPRVDYLQDSLVRG
jgi:hypothetical protein